MLGTDFDSNTLCPRKEILILLILSCMNFTNISEHTKRLLSSMGTNSVANPTKLYKKFVAGKFPKDFLSIG